MFVIFMVVFGLIDFFLVIMSNNNFDLVEDVIFFIIMIFEYFVKFFFDI